MGDHFGKWSPQQAQHQAHQQLQGLIPSLQGFGMGMLQNQALQNQNWAPNTFITTTSGTNTAGATFTIPPSPPSPVTPKIEDEIAWLRRRVREVLWRP